MARLVSICLYLVSFLALLATVTSLPQRKHQPVGVLAANGTLVEAAPPFAISKACGFAYLNIIPGRTFLVANKCSSVHSNPLVKVERAVNENCVTCWFFENDGCTGGIAWHGLIAPKEEISFPPARSYICRV